MWKRVYQRNFLLHVNPRPQIIIHYRFQSRLIAIGCEKVGSWDLNFVGWLIPFQITPDGRMDGRWKRLYLGNQQHVLSIADLQGSIEVRPKLWIPDLKLTIWEKPFDFAEERLDRIEEKIDDITTFGGY
ncbi:hypothetical protein NIES4101_28840 [Calothrix sp. NIES-4101]|nr:hypothetical protein NIES4101_28840 [Calothrix sp. NIES-4101]